MSPSNGPKISNPSIREAGQMRTPISLPPADTLAEARNDTPHLATAGDMLIELIKETSLIHRMRIRSMTEVFQRLMEASPDLHEQVFADKKISAKILEASRVLAESQRILAKLEFLITHVSAEVEDCKTNTQTEKVETTNVVRDSVRALGVETQTAIGELEAIITQLNAQGTKAVPELPPGADSLAKRDDQYIEAFTNANPKAMVANLKGMAEDCLATIIVGLDRATTHAEKETERFRQQLGLMEQRLQEAERHPIILPQLLMNYQGLLADYNACVRLSEKLIEKMPLPTLHMLLAQKSEKAIVTLEAQLKNAIRAIRARGLDSENTRIVSQLESMLSGAEAAGRMKRGNPEPTEEASEESEYSLAPPKVPNI